MSSFWRKSPGRSAWSHSVSALAHLLVLVSLALAPAATLAQTAPSNISFQPGTVSNATSTSILVSAAGLQAGAQVVLDNFGALVTTVEGAGLRAEIPAGIPAGAYTVRVVNPDGGTATAAAPLNVLGPTSTPAPTTTPAPTAFARPQLVVISFGASTPEIVPDQNLDFEMTVQNAGGGTATNIVAEFVAGDFQPRTTGGIRSLGSLAPGATSRFFQPLYATKDLRGKQIAVQEVKVTYTNPEGQSYSDSFRLTFPVKQPVSGPVQPTATPTTAPIVRPQLLVTAYNTDVAQLQPGSAFSLELDLQNVGTGPARRVTLIVGGGSTSSVPGGTPDPGNPGGVTGGGGDFTNFAPLGASNVQSLGDLEAGQTFVARQPLIVNSTTAAGAFPMKLTFIYIDAQGKSYQDDQVITLLVFKSPQVEIAFSRDPGLLIMGQPNILPLQVTNLRKDSTILGNMRVGVAEDSGSGATFENNTALIGALEAGGSYPLDATVYPDAAGTLPLVVTINYTDDFNQPQTITATLDVEVMDAPPIDPNFPPDGGPVDPGIDNTQESFTDMLVRFLKGFLGLGSGRSSPGGGGTFVEPAVPEVISVPPKGRAQNDAGL